MEPGWQKQTIKNKPVVAPTLLPAHSLFPAPHTSAIMNEHVHPVFPDSMH